MEFNFDGPGDPRDFLRRALRHDGEHVDVVRGSIRIHDGETLADQEIDLVSEPRNEVHEHPWTAHWFVPDTEEGSFFINALLNDDVRCAMELNDGRAAEFTWMYSGSYVLMHGLAPLR